MELMKIRQLGNSLSLIERGIQGLEGMGVVIGNFLTVKVIELGPLQKMVDGLETKK